MLLIICYMNNINFTDKMHYSNRTFPELATPLHMLKKTIRWHKERQPTSFRSGVPIPSSIFHWNFNTSCFKYCSAGLIKRILVWDLLGWFWFLYVVFKNDMLETSPSLQIWSSPLIVTFTSKLQTVHGNTSLKEAKK